MVLNVVFVLLLGLYKVNSDLSSHCGCKELRECYHTMLTELIDRDEVPCIEDASIGASTVLIFLKAISQYCSDYLKYKSEYITFEGRSLYEVELGVPKKNEKTSKPVIIIDAGQLAGTEPVSFALYLIEQLVACKENEYMLEQVKWVIMPSSNPDGQEYARYSQTNWRKNLKPSDDKMSVGVDISRNFESHFSSCPRVESGFSSKYPGPSASSENETMFIKSVLNKHLKKTKLYLTIKKDGHHILYPFAYTNTKPPNSENLTKVAAEVARRVNQRTSGVHQFVNISIHTFEGADHCGHSVDYAYDIGIPLVFEMRVFVGFYNRIMSKFQTMPKGYDNSLRNGYFSGIKELYNAVLSDKKSKNERNFK